MPEERDIRKRFGEHLRALRVGQGLSGYQMSTLCSCDRTYLAAIERGAKSPSIETLQKLAKGLKILLTELLDFETKENLELSPEDKLARKISALAKGSSRADQERFAAMVTALAEIYFGSRKGKRRGSA